MRKDELPAWSGVVVRAATIADLDGIMEVEKEAWAEGVGEDAAADSALMRSRIALCNRGGPPWWFLVVTTAKRIEGYVIIQPTAISPEECSGWMHATDEGRLEATFDLRGPYVCGVGLGMRGGAPQVAADLLMAAGHSLRVVTQRDVLYLCGRMPGFAKAHRNSGILAEEYCRKRRGDGSLADPFLRHFEDMISVSPERLLVNGFPPDKDSGGHGVLCVSRNAMESLARSAARLNKLSSTGGVA